MIRFNGRPAPGAGDPGSPSRRQAGVVERRTARKITRSDQRDTTQAAEQGKAKFQCPNREALCRTRADVPAALSISLRPPAQAFRYAWCLGASPFTLPELASNRRCAGGGSETGRRTRPYGDERNSTGSRKAAHGDMPRSFSKRRAWTTDPARHGPGFLREVLAQPFSHGPLPQVQPCRRAELFRMSVQHGQE